MNITLFRLFSALDLSPLPKVGANGDNSVVKTILTFFWVVMGAVCLLVITLSGFRFVLSRGEPQAVAKAKNAILYAAVGLVISVSAAAIVGFVFNRL